MSQPRVSILIPNYNNGRESSHDGQTDLLGDLLQSLYDTLKGEQTPFEIIIRDDGSTDDSLQTAIEWSNKTWPSGDPFCQIHQQEHTGILSITANQLTRESTGEICVRLDGDITCSTENWVTKLCKIFDESQATLGIVGPKQLGVQGRIHSAGDWILHQRGNHHIAFGQPADAVQQSIEVDHVMGCFYCYKREVWEEVGGFDESFLRGQTVDFGMMARHKGWRTMSVPNIEFVHRHALRKPRKTSADTDDGVLKSLKRFEEKWGFSRISPDLDLIKEKYAGTPLLWNARIFGPRQNNLGKATDEAVTLNNSEWQRFAEDEPFRRAVQARLAMVGRMRAALGDPMAAQVSVDLTINHILHLPSRAGLLAHLLAKDGLRVTGIDPNAALTKLASSVVARESYNHLPEFHTMDDDRTIPLETHTVDAVLVTDYVEHCWNPVALIRELHRVVRGDGIVGFISPARPNTQVLDDIGPHHFQTHELDLLLRGTRLFTTSVISQTFPNSGLVAVLAKPVTNQSVVEVKSDKNANISHPVA